jgi:hypothetical protein
LREVEQRVAAYDAWVDERVAREAEHDVAVKDGTGGVRLRPALPAVENRPSRLTARGESAPAAAPGSLRTQPAAAATLGAASALRRTATGEGRSRAGGERRFFDGRVNCAVRPPRAGGAMAKLPAAGNLEVWSKLASDANLEEARSAPGGRGNKCATAAHLKDALVRPGRGTPTTRGRPDAATQPADP